MFLRATFRSNCRSGRRGDPLLYLKTQLNLLRSTCSDLRSFRRASLQQRWWCIFLTVQFHDIKCSAARKIVCLSLHLPPLAPSSSFGVRQLCGFAELSYDRLNWPCKYSKRKVLSGTVTNKWATKCQGQHPNNTLSRQIPQIPSFF